jgi:hypothetical protein
MIHISEPVSPAQMGSLTPEEVTLLNAQRTYDQAMVGLVHAALILGDHETAKYAGERSGQSEFVKTVIAAIDQDDDARCECEQPTIDAPQGKTETVAKYVDHGGVPYWSDKHNTYVRLYRSTCCEHFQAIPEHPDKDVASIPDHTLPA